MAAGKESPKESSLKFDDTRLMEIDIGESRSQPLATNVVDKLRSERLLTGRLAVENEDLRKEVLVLRDQMRKLSVSFSVLRNRNERLCENEGPESLRDDLLRHGRSKHAQYTVTVLDANDELGMVVLGAGSMDGMRPGLVYRVVREGRVTARLRIAIVRRRIAGAKVLEEGKVVFPGPGDKAVLGRTRKKRN